MTCWIRLSNGSASDGGAGRAPPSTWGRSTFPGDSPRGWAVGSAWRGAGFSTRDPRTRKEARAAGAEEFLEPAPRRYDPRTLPLGLLQAAGHFGHRKCLAELEQWASPSARAVARGGLRTLRTDGRQVVYDQGIHPVPAGEAGLYMIDAEMNKCARGRVPGPGAAGLAGLLKREEEEPP